MFFVLENIVSLRLAEFLLAIAVGSVFSNAFIVVFTREQPRLFVVGSLTKYYSELNYKNSTQENRHWLAVDPRF